VVGRTEQQDRLSRFAYRVDFSQKQIDYRRPPIPAAIVHGGAVGEGFDLVHKTNSWLLGDKLVKEIVHHPGLHHR
jgi:hypothetical protein